MPATPDLRKSSLLPKLSPAWQALWLLIHVQNARSYLSRFARFCVSRSIGPREVTQLDLLAFFAAESDSGRKGDCRALVNTCVGFWNDLAGANRLRWLMPIPNGRDAVAAEKAALPMSLTEEISSYLSVINKSKKTAVAIRNRLTDAALIARGVGIDLTYFAKLAEPETLQLFMTAGPFGPLTIESARRRRILQEIGRLLHRRGLSVEADLIDRAEKLQPAQSLQIPAAKRRLLARFDGPDQLARLYAACLAAVEEFAARPDRRKLAPAQAGIAILITLVTVCTRAELCRTRFDGPARPQQPNGRPQLAMDWRGERILVEERLPKLAPLLDRYYAAARALLGRPPLHLQETTAGDCKSGAAVTIAIGKVTEAAGQRLTPDSLADLAVYLLMKLEGLAPKDLRDAAGYRHQFNFDQRFSILDQQRAPAKLAGRLVSGPRRPS